MAALLVAIAVMGVLMSAAIPSWKTLVQREREAELIFRGEQYARAVGLFQRKYAGAFPPNLDTLLQQKFLRKKYLDPVTGKDFQLLYQGTAMAVSGQPGTAGSGAVGSARPGQIATPPGLAAVPGPGPGGAAGTVGPRGGIVGVASTSPQSSFRLYKGRGKYNEWQFVYTQTSSGVGAPGEGQPRPGMPGAVRPGGVPGTPRPGMIGPRPPGGFPPNRP
jgi:type II secretory pathway pseudopilin PulG